ncbi:MAG TPA: hypothetical protein VFD36_29330 [Kofleriaceae bacterium]|nr:hypothetical protein [Kofleriaceae bacterium]
MRHALAVAAMLSPVPPVTEDVFWRAYEKLFRRDYDEERAAERDLDVRLIDVGGDG